MHKFPYRMDDSPLAEECLHVGKHGPHRNETLDSSRFLSDNKWHLLLCASGSVATIKIPNMVQALSRYGNLSIRIVLTTSAAHFLEGQSKEQPSLDDIQDMPNVDGIYKDVDEWVNPWIRGAKILHIELRRWADLMVVAPLSANTLAKVVGGLCDNLLLSTFRAWDTTGILDPPHVVKGSARIQELDDDTDEEDIMKDDGTKRKKIIVAPAMNTAMWFHPVTKRHMELLEGEWNVENGGWIEVCRPMEKVLACGDTGSGAMADWRGIVKMIEDEFELSEE